MKSGMVYATPRMVSDVEYTCIDHLAATPIGLEVQIGIEIVEIDRRKVVFSFSVKDSVEEVGRGTHVRFVVETARTRERLAAKRAKAGLP